MRSDCFLPILGELCDLLWAHMELKADQAAGRKSLASAQFLLLLLPGLAGCASTAARPAQTPTPDPAVAGGQLFEIHCAECHGPSGEGHALPSAPALDSTEHAFHHPDWELRQFIGDGKISFGPVDMPAFRDRLTEQEIEFVIAYLKSLWTEEARQFQESVNQRLILPSATP